MDKRITGFNAAGITYEIVNNPKDFTVLSGEFFVQSMTNKTKTKASTIGEATREQLHTFLDEWIDNVIKEKKA
jgi:hypothetical protein